MGFLDQCSLYQPLNSAVIEQKEPWTTLLYINERAMAVVLIVYCSTFRSLTLIYYLTITVRSLGPSCRISQGCDHGHLDCVLIWRLDWGKIYLQTHSGCLQMYFLAAVVLWEPRGSASCWSLSAPRGHSAPCYVVLSTGPFTTWELASSKPKREKVSAVNLGAQKNFN